MPDVPYFISLGAGVQSSTMALMCARGALPYCPKAAIFADTQAEPKAVYDWLRRLEGYIKASPHPFPVHRVTAGSLEEDSLRHKTSAKTGRIYVREVVPVYLKMPDGGRATLWRRCSRDYKIRPILREIRRLTRVSRGETSVVARSMIGISTDEAHRIKPSRDPRVENVWPLIDAGLSRADCLTWMTEHHYPAPPRSACVFCPYHSNAEWQRLKDEAPKDFERAARWEDRLVAACKVDERYVGIPHAWWGLVPLRQAQFGAASRRDGFGEECEGICNV